MTLPFCIKPFNLSPHEMHVESKRRLDADLAGLGPEPPWWRPRKRRQWRRARRRLLLWHSRDLEMLLGEPDPARRAIAAHLIGWTS